MGRRYGERQVRRGRSRLVVVLLATVLVVLVSGGTFMALALTAKLRHRTDSDPAQAYSARELYTRAVDQQGQGQYSEAERYLELALTKEESNAYRSQLAVVKYQLKKYDEAIALYQLLVDAKYELAFDWNGIGNVYRDWADAGGTNISDARSRAEAAYRTAIQVEPNYTAAYSNLAQMLAANGQREAALTVLNQGISQTNNQDLIRVRALLNR